MKKTLGFAITGSFCTHQQILKVLENLSKHFEIIPIVSQVVQSTNTRFGKASDFLKKVETICKNKAICSILEAEPLGPKNVVDILVVAPCTGNTLSKLANGITDNAVTMLVKAHTRNNKPVVVGISTNDALGLNLKNLATLINSKNFFFIPFNQDDFLNKPKSLVSNFDLTEKTIEEALLGKQLQPIIFEKPQKNA